MKPDATQRRLGRTDHTGLLVALGGVSLMRVPLDEAIALGHRALDLGVTHFDVAPTYGDAQFKMGHVVRERRGEIFLSCKTAARDAAEARAELAESLRLLQTDHIDLYQFHALDTEAELDQVTGPGGALEAFEEARKAGVVRYLGVTGHRHAVHLKTIERLALDTVMAPLNFRTYDAMCGAGGLIEKARARGMGIIAIKATTRGEIKPTATAYRFTLSQDVDVTVPAGKEFLEAAEIGRTFAPLTAAEQAAFVEHCRATYEVEKVY